MAISSLSRATSSRFMSRSKTVTIVSILVHLLVLSNVQAKWIVASGCDMERINRCRSEITDIIQPYPTKNIPYGGVSGPLNVRHRDPAGICRSIRTNLDCYISEVPACIDFENLRSKDFKEFILRVTNYLENNCDWGNSRCFDAPEVKTCEQSFIREYRSKHNEIYYDISQSVACQVYGRFKNCVNKHIRSSCSSSDLTSANEYLISKVDEYVWTCRLNNTDVITPPNQPWPSWPSNQVPCDKDHYPPITGDHRDRQEPINVDSPNCIQRASVYLARCEDQLVEQENLPISSGYRPNPCCPLRRYRNCLSQVLEERCSDVRQADVDTLMGDHKHEMNYYCKSQRELCSDLESRGVKSPINYQL